MKPALGYKWVEPLHSWLEVPFGEQLKGLESAILKQRLSYCYGEHLLKVGCLTNQIDTSSCKIDHQISLSLLDSNYSPAGVRGEFDELPFLQNSIDALMMNHVVEFCPDPHQVLREAHRVLLPNGSLILSVFNPVSMLFPSKLWPFKSHGSFWKARMFTVGRIKDWLNLLGFEVVDESYCCYSGLLGSNKVLDHGFISSIMANDLPYLGSVCVISAKKREWPLTPIRPRVRYKTRFSPAVRGAAASKIQN